MQYILGAYSQLPFGSSSDEYEALLSRQLKPLLTKVYKEPNLRLLFHLSASEYEYFEINHPEINMLICDLCRKGQMELLSSSYYDVVLSLLPTHERSSHVEKTTTYLRKRFSKRPKGLWCYNQIFSPTLIPNVNMSGLDYIMISSYNQIANVTMLNKPFYMDEMGKTTIIFPFDDKYSKETAELAKGNLALDKYLTDMGKLAASASGAINTIMLNLDQLTSVEGSQEVFPLLYSKLGQNCTLPSLFLSQNEIKRYFYFTTGVYGRDISLGKALSINQYILESPVSSQNFAILNLLREAMRDCKKNTDERKNLEKLFMKASSSGLYMPNQNMVPAIRRVSNRCLCEMEAILSKIPNSYMPISKNGVQIITGKSSVCYLNPKGATLSRLNILSANYDIAMNSGEGIFADSFIDNSTGKEIKLSAKTFELTPDKRRTDFLTKLPLQEVKKVPLCIIKRYKFRQSTISVEVDIENLDANNSLEGVDYCCTLDLSLPKAFEVKTTSGEVIDLEGKKTSSFGVNDSACPFSVLVAMDDEALVSCKNNEQKVHTCIGDKTFYEYTQIKIRKKISLKGDQDSRFTIGLKIEKRKEKSNDITE